MEDWESDIAGLLAGSVWCILRLVSVKGMGS